VEVGGKRGSANDWREHVRENMSMGVSRRIILGPVFSPQVPFGSRQFSFVSLVHLANKFWDFDLRYGNDSDVLK
jgi:hypothetical protein